MLSKSILWFALAALVLISNGNARPRDGHANEGHLQERRVTMAMTMGIILVAALVGFLAAENYIGAFTCCIAFAFWSWSGVAKTISGEGRQERRSLGPYNDHVQGGWSAYGHHNDHRRAAVSSDSRSVHDGRSTYSHHQYGQAPIASSSRSDADRDGFGTDHRGPSDWDTLRQYDRQVPGPVNLSVSQSSRAGNVTLRKKNEVGYSEVQQAPVGDLAKKSNGKMVQNNAALQHPIHAVKTARTPPMKPVDVTFTADAAENINERFFSKFSISAPDDDLSSQDFAEKFPKEELSKEEVLNETQQPLTEKSSIHKTALDKNASVAKHAADAVTGEFPMKEMKHDVSQSPKETSPFLDSSDMKKSAAVENIEEFPYQETSDDAGQLSKNKSKLLETPALRKSAFIYQVDRVNEVFCPFDLAHTFLKAINDCDDFDTIGYLVGDRERNSHGQHVISELYIPPQSAVFGENGVINVESLDYSNSMNRVILGWIRVDSSGDCFPSWDDIHIQYEFQKLESAAIGILVDRKSTKNRVFALTRKGLQTCQVCKKDFGGSYHKHPDDTDLYHYANHCLIGRNLQTKLTDSREIVVPCSSLRAFFSVVDEHDYQTIGYLLGKMQSDGRYVISELYLPPQSAKHNSNQVSSFGTLNYAKTRKLSVLGWVRKVDNGCAWSHSDLHRQYEFQKSRSSFFGFALDPKHRDVQCFSLTEEGLKNCMICKLPFNVSHKHSVDHNVSEYQAAQRYATSRTLECKVVDYRTAENASFSGVRSNSSQKTKSLDAPSTSKTKKRVTWADDDAPNRMARAFSVPDVLDDKNKISQDSPSDELLDDMHKAFYVNLSSAPAATDNLTDAAAVNTAIDDNAEVSQDSSAMSGVHKASTSNPSSALESMQDLTDVVAINLAVRGNTEIVQDPADNAVNDVLKAPSSSVDDVTVNNAINDNAETPQKSPTINAMSDVHTAATVNSISPEDSVDDSIDDISVIVADCLENASVSIHKEIGVLETRANELKSQISGINNKLEASRSATLVKDWLTKSKKVERGKEASLNRLKQQLESQLHLIERQLTKLKPPQVSVANHNAMKRTGKNRSHHSNRNQKIVRSGLATTSAAVDSCAQDVSGLIVDDSITEDRSAQDLSSHVMKSYTVSESSKNTTADENPDWLGPFLTSHYVAVSDDESHHNGTDSLKDRPAIEPIPSLNDEKRFERVEIVGATEQSSREENSASHSSEVEEESFHDAADEFSDYEVQGWSQRQDTLQAQVLDVIEQSPLEGSSVSYSNDVEEAEEGSGVDSVVQVHDRRIQDGLQRAENFDEVGDFLVVDAVEQVPDFKVQEKPVFEEMLSDIQQSSRTEIASDSSEIGQGLIGEAGEQILTGNVEASLKGENVPDAFERSRPIESPASDMDETDDFQPSSSVDSVSLRFPSPCIDSIMDEIDDFQPSVPLRFPSPSIDSIMDETDDFQPSVSLSFPSPSIDPVIELIFPFDLPHTFARKITDNDTVGYLLGNMESDSHFVITQLYLPAQPNTLDDYIRTNRSNLVVLGWIRKAPADCSLSCFEFYQKFGLDHVSQRPCLCIVTPFDSGKPHVFSIAADGYFKGCQDCATPNDALQKHSSSSYRVEHAEHCFSDERLQIKLVDHRAHQQQRVPVSRSLILERNALQQLNAFFSNVEASYSSRTMSMDKRVIAQEVLSAYINSISTEPTNESIQTDEFDLASGVQESEPAITKPAPKKMLAKKIAPPVESVFTGSKPLLSTNIEPTRTVSNPVNQPLVAETVVPRAVDSFFKNLSSRRSQKREPADEKIIESRSLQPEKSSVKNKAASILKSSAADRELASGKCTSNRSLLPEQSSATKKAASLVKSSAVDPKSFVKGQTLNGRTITKLVETFLSNPGVQDNTENHLISRGILFGGTDPDGNHTVTRLFLPPNSGVPEQWYQNYIASYNLKKFGWIQTHLFTDMSSIDIREFYSFQKDESSLVGIIVDPTVPTDTVPTENAFKVMSLSQRAMQELQAGNGQIEQIGADALDEVPVPFRVDDRNLKVDDLSNCLLCNQYRFDLFTVFLVISRHKNLSDHFEYHPLKFGFESCDIPVAAASSPSPAKVAGPRSGSFSECKISCLAADSIN